MEKMKIIHSRGFSLIEVMVVLALMGLLTSLAIASYSDSVRKAARGDAQTALVGLASVMQMHYTENTPSTFRGAASGGGDTGAPAIFPAQSPLDGQNKQYNLTIQSATASAYEVRAVPISGSSAAKDKCGTLTLTSTGVRGINGGDDGVTADDCWR
jgi:type IV pilus assembly protein PilE